jgi:hypothetical protein
MKNNLMVISLIALVVGAGGGFFAGEAYQQSKTPTFNRQFAGTGGQGRNGFRPVSGTILSADDKSVTVKLPDGSSKIIILSGTTAINQATTATTAELKVGTTVAVFGTTNSDGSVTAQSIQLNPQMRLGDGGPDRQPSQPTPTP